ncbi:MAG: protein kinase [Planctomycetia bacterium]|nr:protein kinase [Planctomycetia bacterium]
MKPELLTLERFLELLRSANLLSAEDLARVEKLASHEDYQEPGPIAWWLVEQNLVTRWQAHMLVSGRNRFFLGKYKLLDRIGVGGMGTVYKAWQPGLSRVVALKVLSDALVGNELAAARFHREIQSASSLTHPHIVATFDADSVAGKHFLVMEYVDGENLEMLARRRGPLPVAEACEYIRQAAVGLAHAHERGMIHRDIKPANLLLSRATAGGPAPAEAPGEANLPVVKILDFGLARLTTEKQGDTELTQAGQVMGTPDYIAPEQARDTRLADYRSDVYSLGCALFRLLTGRVPFVRPSVMEKLMARALEDAPRARSLRAELPPQLDDCIARMLEREPARRYQSAGEVAQALESLAATGANLPVALPLGATTAASTISGAAALYHPISASDAELEQFLAVLADQGDSGGSLGGFSGDTTRAAIAAGATRVDAPRPAMQTAPHQQTRRSTAARAATRRRLTANLPLVISAVLLVPLSAAWGWYALTGTRLDIDWPAEERNGASFEIDGREPILSGKLSFSGRPGKRRLKITRPGYEPIDEEIVLASGAAVSYRPEWVPTPQTVRRQQWSALKAEAERFLSSGDKSASGHAIDPLRRKIDEVRCGALATREGAQAAGMLRRLPAPADRLTHAMIPDYERRISGGGNRDQAPQNLVAVIGDSRWKHGSPIYAIAYSPDDSIIAAGDNFGFLKLWNARTGEELATARASESAIMSLAFNPDGKSLITGSADSQARIWSVPALKVEQTLDGHFNQIRGAAWSPRDNLVATGALDNSVRIWDPAGGSPVRDIRQGVGEVACVAFSPDGKLLAVGHHRPRHVAILEVATGHLVASLAGHQREVLAVAFNRDGSRLLTGGYDEKIRCWNTADWQEVRSIPLRDNAGVAALHYSGAGTTVVVGLGNGHVELHDAESGSYRQTLACDDLGLAALSISHDGTRLAMAGGGQVIRIWDLKTYEEGVPAPPAVLSFAASPDGRWLALGMRSGLVDLWDLATGEKQAALQGTARRVGEIAFSPDGLLLATAGDSGDSPVRVWDVAAREVRHVLHGHRAYAAGLAFSPDARTLASASHDGNVRLWNTQTGGIVDTLESKGAPPLCVAFSPDGKTLAAGHARDGSSSRVRLWDAVRGKEKKPVSLDWNGIVGVAFGTDDQLLLAGYQFQGVKVWDPSRGTARSTYFGTGAFAVSPDGTHLAVDEKPGISIYELAHGIRSTELSLGRPDLWTMQLAYTPEGRHLAVLASNGTVHILRLAKDEAK